jgi:hypothetical protein
MHALAAAAVHGLQFGFVLVQLCPASASATKPSI